LVKLGVIFNYVRIAVIDGQGGGIGKNIIEKLRKELLLEVEILALGTNAIATSNMLKSGANEGASGENAIMQNVDKVDIILGTLSILVAYSMLGEFTPKMAEAVAKSKAKKILLPLNRSGVEIVGVSAEPLPHLVDYMVDQVKKLVVK